MIYLRQIITRINQINKLYNIKNIRCLSCPALQLPEEFPSENNIELILDHGYVCPICRDRGFVACNYCTKGCILCDYSGVVKCKCQSKIFIPILNE